MDKDTVQTQNSALIGTVRRKTPLVSTGMSVASHNHLAIASLCFVGRRSYESIHSTLEG
jgi:hypothetical protein